MVKLYKSISTGKIHLLQAGYICNQALGKLKSNMEGMRDDITCKNCRFKLNW